MKKLIMNIYYNIIIHLIYWLFQRNFYSFSDYAIIKKKVYTDLN